MDEEWRRARAAANKEAKMELAQTCDKKKRSQHCRVSTTVDRRGGRRPRNTWKRDLVNRGTWAGGRWTRQHKTDKKLISRWDSERELFYDDIVHALQNTIDSCRNSAIDRRGYVLERRFTKFSEITQYNGHYVVQGRRFWYQLKNHIGLRLPTSD